MTKKRRKWLFNQSEVRIAGEEYTRSLSLAEQKAEDAKRDSFLLFGKKERASKIAVWTAAIGDPNDLVALLKSDWELSPAVRVQLALLIQGKLVPEKRAPNRPRKANFPSSAMRYAHFTPLARAVDEYRTNRAASGTAEKAKAALAKRFGIPLEELISAINRSQRVAPLNVTKDETYEFREWLELNNIEFRSK